jgi:hypothetical protein
VRTIVDHYCLIKSETWILFALRILYNLFDRKFTYDSVGEYANKVLLLPWYLFVFVVVFWSDTLIHFTSEKKKVIVLNKQNWKKEREVVEQIHSRLQRCCIPCCTRIRLEIIRERERERNIVTTVENNIVRSISCFSHFLSRSFFFLYLLSFTRLVSNTLVFNGISKCIIHWESKRESGTSLRTHTLLTNVFIILSHFFLLYTFTATTILSFIQHNSRLPVLQNTHTHHHTYVK